MSTMAFDIFARDHASRVFDNVGDSAERLGRRIDGAGKSTGGLRTGLGGLGDIASGLGTRLGHAGSQLASMAVSAVSLAGKVAVAAGALATLAAGAASAAGYTVSLAAALTPVGGLVAALPGLLLTGAAAMTTWKLATYGVGEAMAAAFSGDDKALTGALAKITEAAGEFVTEFQTVLPALKSFQAAAQEGFFSQLNGSLSELVARLSGLKPALRDLASEFGLLVRHVLDFAATQHTIDQLNLIFRHTQALVGAVSVALQPLLTGFVDLGLVGSSWLANMSDGLQSVLTTFGEWMTRVAGSGQAWAWMDGALVVLKQLGSLTKDLWDILAGLLGAAKQAGSSALGVLGSLVDAFAQWVNSAKGQEVLVEIFKALNQVGSALLPIIVALGQAVALIAPEVGKIAAVFGPILARAIAALGPAVAALGPGIIAMINGIGSAVNALAPSLLPLGEAISVAFASLQPLFAALGVGVAALLPGVQALLIAAGQGIAALAPALRPVGEALGGIFAALAPLLPVIGQLAAMIATSLAVGVQAILPSLSLLVVSFGQALLALSPIVPLILQLATTLVNSLVPALAPLLPQIADLVVKLASGLLPALLPLIPIISNIAGVIAQTFVSVLGQLINVTLQLLPPLSQAAQIIGLALLDAVTQLAPYIPQLVAAFLSCLPAVINLLPPIAQLAVSLLPRFLDAVVQILPLLPGLITCAIQLTQAWYPLIPIFTDLLTRLAPHIPLFIEIAAVIATKLLPPLLKLAETVVYMVDTVNGAFQRMYDTLIGHSIIPDLINGIDQWFGRLPGMLLGWVGQAKDAAIGQFQNLIGWAGSLPGQLVGALGNMGGLLGGVGHDLIIGLWNGMVGMFNWFRDSVYNFFNAIMPQWVKDALGIHSPSKVFEQLGRQLPAGMALGITKASGLVRNAVEGLAGMAAVNATTQLGISSGAGGMSAPIVPQSTPTLVFNFAGQPLIGRDEITRIVVAALNEAKGRGFNLGFAS